jgi:two-component system LytT family response regulator
MIRVLIIENESSSEEILVSHIKEFLPDVEILEVCETIAASLNAIKKYLPDLVFLDVELNNKENGFEILEKLDKINFEVIVTTIHDKYAMQACKASALDFLLKPIPKDELIAAIEKYKKRKSQGIDPKQIELLLSIYQNPNLPLKKLAVPTMEGLDFVETDNIIYCEGADNQTKVYFSAGKKEFVNGILKSYEELLSHSNFCRIHKSYLINLNHTKKYIKGRDGKVVMTNDTTLPVSRDFKDDFLRRFGRQ